jgi:phosphatidate phosphatase PAH1
LGEELEKDLLSLKQSIDFKALTNFFHIFKEQMDIVKSHREDFHTKFKEDDGESISRLLEESKLNNEVTSEKIRQINSKKEEMVKNEGKIEKDETKELSFKITNIILEIDNLNNEKVKEGKRNVKIKIDRERIIMEIKGNLIKEGVVIVP